MPRPLSAALLAAACLPLAAGDAPAPASPWSWDLKLGAYLQNVAASNAANSHDSAIAGTVDSVSYKLSGEGTLVWREDKDRVEQKLLADYGRQKIQGQADWTENADRLFYTGTYERTLARPHFLYLNWQAESVVTGPEPDTMPLNPLIAKLATGYGQRYEGLLPIRDALVWRAGVYASKRWEQDADAIQTDVQCGPEVLLRYERTQSADVSYFAQLESRSEFTDPGHTTSTAEAGLNVKVGKVLNVVVKARAYYETAPTDLRNGGNDGYDVLSTKEEALVGLQYNIRSP